MPIAVNKAIGGKEYPPFPVTVERGRIKDFARAVGGAMTSPHGEQEFEIHRQLVPGETYLCRTRVVDVYEKTGRSGPMAFVVRETAVTDRAGEIVVSMRQVTVVRL